MPYRANGPNRANRRNKANRLGELIELRSINYCDGLELMRDMKKWVR